MKFTPQLSFIFTLALIASSSYGADREISICADYSSRAREMCVPASGPIEDYPQEAISQCVHAMLTDWYADAEISSACTLEYLIPGGWFQKPRLAYRLVEKTR